VVLGCTLMIPTIHSLHTLFFDEHSCIHWLIERGIFDLSRQFGNCGDTMRLDVREQLFRCTKRVCKSKVGIRKCTFFEGCRIPFSKVMLLAYLWLCGADWTTTFNMTGHSEHTVTAFFRHFRQLIMSTLDDDDCVIGGPGVGVEIDETKLGKRKYHRGHRVEGVWVLVGVERTPQRRVFLFQVPDRSEATLLPIIAAHVLPGSIILTDRWRGYMNVQERLGLEHRTVNHSVEFLNSVDGTCTNTVEGYNGLKLKIAPRNRTEDGISEHLGEFIWRRKNSMDLWESFVRALVEINYVLV